MCGLRSLCVSSCFVGTAEPNVTKVETKRLAGKVRVVACARRKNERRDSDAVRSFSVAFFVGRRTSKASLERLPNCGDGAVSVRDSQGIDTFGKQVEPMRFRNKICLGAVLIDALSQQVAAVRAIETAGTLFVDLSATSATAGSPVWTNAGTLGNFIEIGDPRLVTVAGGVSAVVFDGIDDVYQSPVNAPAELTGLDPTRTIEAWVLNPSIAAEETIVSWGHRGGPDGSNISFNYGNNGTYGAVGHWGGADIGWNDAGGAPAANQWHHLVFSYDGTTSRVYSDGALMKS